MGSVIEPSVDMSTVAGERSLLSKLLSAGTGGAVGALLVGVLAKKLAPLVSSRLGAGHSAMALGAGVGAGAGMAAGLRLNAAPLTSEIAREAGIGATRGYPWSSAKAEAVELLEELRAMNGPGIREELGDTLMSTQLAAYKNLGVDTPAVFPATEAGSKYVSRKRTWDQIADAYGLEFDTEQLARGSNYEREAKRDGIITGLMADQGVSNVTLDRGKLPGHVAGLDWRPMYSVPNR